jgi:hypothetical protein
VQVAVVLLGVFALPVLIQWITVVNLLVRSAGKDWVLFRTVAAQEQVCHAVDLVEFRHSTVGYLFAEKLRGETPPAPVLVLLPVGTAPSFVSTFQVNVIHPEFYSPTPVNPPNGTRTTI